MIGEKILQIIPLNKPCIICWKDPDDENYMSTEEAVALALVEGRSGDRYIDAITCNEFFSLAEDAGNFLGSAENIEVAERIFGLKVRN